MERRGFDPWPLIAGASTTLLVLVVGLQLWQRWVDPIPADQLRALRLIHEKVLEEHVAEQDAKALVYAAIEGMVGSTDRYSTFVPPAAVEQFEEEEITGTFQGIGVVLVADVTPPTIEFPLPDGPAALAGIEVGDRIVEVAGEPIVGETALEQRADAVERIRGPAGESVEIVVEHAATGERRTLAIERGSVRRPAAKWTRLVGGEDRRFGYVYLQDFQRGVTAQFDEALDVLSSDAAAAGGPLEGLVLDLRGNGGGLLSEAVALVNRFVAEGVIVSMKRRGEVVVERHEATAEVCTHPDLPLVVLVDGRSASASEVVAGALQDYDRGALVGQRTFGKGVVQSIYRWKRLDFRLKLTTSHYYTPKGRSIERANRRDGDPDAAGGLTPDRPVELDNDAASRLRLRLRDFEVPREYRDLVADRIVDALGARARGAPGLDEDVQLAAAVDELAQRVERVRTAAAGGR